MPSPSPQPSVLLLERADVEHEPVPDTTARLPRPSTGADPAPGAVPGATSPASLFRAPGLALLAAMSVLEGYRWIGVIASGGSLPWAVAFTGVAVVGAPALTRTDGRRSRSAVNRVVVAASVCVALATAVALSVPEGWATAVLGIADLTLAAAALVALVAGERSRRLGDVAA
jgi:hypothetical protein